MLCVSEGHGRDPRETLWADWEEWPQLAELRQMVPLG